MSIQGDLLDITVVGCTKLRDTEWISRQDPYVVLEYAGKRHRTRTDTDGGRNPKFNEQFRIELVEGLREINVSVWNSNTITTDDFIGSGKILLQKVLCESYDDSVWPLTRGSGRRGGEVRVIMHYRKQQGSYPYPCSYATPPYPTPYVPPAVYVPPAPVYSTPYPPPAPVYSTSYAPPAPVYSTPQPPPYQAPPSPYPPQPYGYQPYQGPGYWPQ